MQLRHQEIRFCAGGAGAVPARIVRRPHRRVSCRWRNRLDEVLIALRRYNFNVGRVSPAGEALTTSSSNATMIAVNRSLLH